MYLPACKTTYIVGPSGCSKSTIGALLGWQYTLLPSEGNGNLLLDEQDMQYFDPIWMGRHVAGIVHRSAARVVRSFGEVYTGTLHLALSEAVDASKMSHTKKFVRLVRLPCLGDGSMALMRATILSLRSAEKLKSKMAESR